MNNEKRENSKCDNVCENYSNNSVSSDDIDDLRYQINRIDGEILDNLSKRLEISNKVGIRKLKTKSPITDMEREKAVIISAQSRFDNSMNNKIESVMSMIMRISRERQYEIVFSHDKNWVIGEKIENAKSEIDFPRKIACQGTFGSYSHLVAGKIYPGAELIPTKSFHDAFKQVIDDKCDIGILPLENTTAGTVNDVVDLLTYNDIYIIKAFSVPISHKLLVLPGTDISKIKSVISHPQALAQCSKFIQKMGWTQINAENTAFAALEIIKNNDESTCAIASKEAANLYELEILPLEICDFVHNQTRFVAISKDMTILSQAEKVSIEFSLPHQSGSLSSVLNLFAERGLNMTKIQSRPVPEKPWEYSFWVDLTAKSGDKELLLALYQLSMELPFLKLIGWYEEVLVEE